MLLESHTGELEVLPALPASWAQGSVTGLRARGGYIVGLAWQNGAIVTAAVQAARAGRCSVRARTPIAVSGSRSKRDGDTHVLTFDVVAGKTYRLTAE